MHLNEKLQKIPSGAVRRGCRIKISDKLQLRQKFFLNRESIVQLRRNFPLPRPGGGAGRDMEKPYCGGQCKRKGRDPLFQRSAAFLLREENYDVRRKAREQRPPAREHRGKLLHQAADGLGVSGGVIHGQALDELCLCVEQSAVLLELVGVTGLLCGCLLYTSPSPRDTR